MIIFDAYQDRGLFSDQGFLSALGGVCDAFLIVHMLQFFDRYFRVSTVKFWGSHGAVA